MEFDFKKIVLSLLLLSLPYLIYAADSDSNPCGGPNDLMLFLDRPTAGDSPCVVPNKSTALEMGYSYENLVGGGVQQNFPQPFLRIGLVHNFEFNVFIPNYNYQTVEPRRGNGPSTLGLKYEIFANPNWVTAVDGYFILPSGSAAFGTRNRGFIINGIVSRTITEEISINGMLGLSNQSESIEGGGRNFYTVNPDLVLSWTKDKLSLFWEVVGQSKTDIGQSSGFNMDEGFLYSIKKNVVVDFSVGQRVSGTLNGFSNYVGAGISFLFS